MTMFRLIEEPGETVAAKNSWTGSRKSREELVCTQKCYYRMETYPFDSFSLMSDTGAFYATDPGLTPSPHYREANKAQWTDTHL